MNNLHLSAALAEEHRAQLLREADQYRRVRAANAGSRRYTTPMLRERLLGWLGRTIRRSADTAIRKQPGDHSGRDHNDRPRWPRWT
jgi:hypothetical protein